MEKFAHKPIDDGCDAMLASPRKRSSSSDIPMPRRHAGTIEISTTLSPVKKIILFLIGNLICQRTSPSSNSGIGARTSLCSAGNRICKLSIQCIPGRRPKVRNIHRLWLLSLEGVVFTMASPISMKCICRTGRRW